MREDPKSCAVMTLTEAAEFIRVSEKTLGEMARAKRIPGKKVGREWRFLREALERWLSESSVPGSEPLTRPLADDEEAPSPKSRLIVS